MSSDILEYIEDEKQNSIGLSMNANGYAFLTIMEPEVPFREEKSLYFILSPDKNGIENAEMILDSLKSWVRQVKSNE